MSRTAAETTAATLPRVSPTRLEAWDRCPAAYRFAYVLRLPQPVADQTPRLLGSVAHALVETYVREAQITGAPPPLDRLPALARALVSGKGLPEATTVGLAREATELVSAWLSRWTVPLAHTVGVEHALAIDVGGERVAWEAPDAFLRGRLDLVVLEGWRATVCDWKSGWVTEDDEELRRAWAPGCYASLLWAWAPRIEAVTVEYHYLRTGRVARTTFARADAIETLAWARTIAAAIAEALARPDDPAAFPPRPSTACATCPWVNRCPAGQAALEAMDEAPIGDDAEARRLGTLLLAGEARVARLRDRLRQYLQDREPLALDGVDLGFFPTKGRYDAAAVFRAATEAGADPWPLLAADGRALAAFLKHQPHMERTLDAAWTPSPPWFGHRKVAASPSNRRARTSLRKGDARRSTRSRAARPLILPGHVKCNPIAPGSGRRDSQSPRVTASCTSLKTPPTTQGERMPTLGLRQEPTAPATPVAEIPDRHQRPGVIITGSCSDSAFVAANVLICADTLSAEEAIRVWLEAHGIRVSG